MFQSPSCRGRRAPHDEPWTMELIPMHVSVPFLSGQARASR